MGYWIVGVLAQIAIQLYKNGKRASNFWYYDTICLSFPPNTEYFKEIPVAETMHLVVGGNKYESSTMNKFKVKS